MHALPNMGTQIMLQKQEKSLSKAKPAQLIAALSSQPCPFNYHTIANQVIRNNIMT